jgi:2-keto-4-pentenoate hydratase/2-oxohepta-3-ene-1,7-dioic acid hydratase in catechol pathway
VDRRIPPADSFVPIRLSHSHAKPVHGFKARSFLSANSHPDQKLLAPVTPLAFFCIGLNYRRHAEEGKAPIPQFPVLFMKTPATRRVGARGLQDSRENPSDL